MAGHDDKKHFDQMYASGFTPWEIGRADKNLEELFSQLSLEGDRALEIGCGTGDNALFLAGQGLRVTATEIVEAPLEQARAKAKDAGARISFHLLDIMEEDVPGAPFHLIFDRGCFHHFRTHELRHQFASRVAKHLAEGGFWLSLCGNADEDRPGPGPPQLSALDIVQAAEPFFQILLLKASRFDSNMEPPPKCWIFLGKVR